MTRQGGQEGDFLLASQAAERFTVLVEIKTPEAELVGTTQYRNRTFAPGSELAAGAVQVQQECSRWIVEGSRTDENRDLLEREHVWTHDPRGILVIGNLEKLGGSREKIRSFELFRRNLRIPEILTFDELLTRAKQMVQVGEASASDIAS